MWFDYVSHHRNVLLDRQMRDKNACATLFPLASSKTAKRTMLETKSIVSSRRASRLHSCHRVYSNGHPAIKSGSVSNATWTRREWRIGVFTPMIFTASLSNIELAVAELGCLLPKHFEHRRVSKELNLKDLYRSVICLKGSFVIEKKRNAKCK